jgi:hypothetical protein
MHMPYTTDKTTLRVIGAWRPPRITSRPGEKTKVFPDADPCMGRAALPQHVHIHFSCSLAENFPLRGPQAPINHTRNLQVDMALSQNPLWEGLGPLCGSRQQDSKQTQETHKGKQAGRNNKTDTCGDRRGAQHAFVMRSGCVLVRLRTHFDTQAASPEGTIYQHNGAFRCV